jgi:hypothetical protein
MNSDPFIVFAMYNLCMLSGCFILYAWRVTLEWVRRAIWDKTNVKYFCDLCKIEVLAGHMPLGHLNKVGWKNVEDKFVEKTGRKLEYL